MKLNKKRLSFSVPLILFLVVVLTLIISIEAFVIVVELKKDLKETQIDSFILNTNSIAEVLEQEIKANENLLKRYSTIVSLQLENSEEERVHNTIGEMGNSHIYFETIFICDLQGKVTYSNTESILGVNISDRAYYKAVMTNGLSSYTTNKAIISKATGNLTVVHGVPLYKDNELVGMLAASFNLTNFGVDHVSNKTVGETGYGYVLDQEGMVLIHHKKELVANLITDVDPLFQQIIENPEKVQTLSYSLDNSLKEGVFVRMSMVDWVVCFAINESEAYKITSEIRLIKILSNAIIVLIVSAFLFLYAKFRLTKRIDTVEDLMSQSAQGILTERGKISGNDEITSMTGFFNDLLDSFSHFFGQLSVSLQDLENVGVDLSSNMEETAAAVHQIRTNVENSLIQIEKQEESVSSTVTTVEEIAQNIRSLDRNIERQSENIQEGSSAVEEMIAQIKTVSSSTEEADRIMTTLKDSSQSGSENLQSVSSMIMGISDKSKELEEANSLIAGIAAQTNLLAMNAAIEAAHAGDSGRGFAVVADEIRKLAEQSTKQSTQVKQTISDINSSVQDVVKGSEKSTHSFEDILNNMNKMERITGEIRSSMEEQVSGSTQVLQSLEEMKSSGLEVTSGSREMTEGNKIILQSVSQLNQISSEVSMAIQEIGNGMEEINKAVEAVSELSQNNRQNIDHVRQEASFYKI